MYSFCSLSTPSYTIRKYRHDNKITDTIQYMYTRRDELLIIITVTALMILWLIFIWYRLRSAYLSLFIVSMKEHICMFDLMLKYWIMHFFVYMYDLLWNDLRLPNQAYYNIHKIIRLSKSSFVSAAFWCLKDIALTRSVTNKKCDSCWKIFVKLTSLVVVKNDSCTLKACKNFVW